MTNRTEHFITCSPGLESILHQEVKELRLSKVEQQVGGVRFLGTMEDAWRANLELRTAIRVLRRLARFDCPDDITLYEAAKKIDWTQFLKPEGSFFVDAQCKESSLAHSQFIAQRTKDAVVDSFRDSQGIRPSIAKEDADLRIHVHLWRDRCTLSVDTSGDSLHKRGWRKYQGFAPVAETIAAAIILQSSWNRRAPLIDPFCGSGTLLMEAGLLASNTAPGLTRSFGFERWPHHDFKNWTKLRAEIQAKSSWPKKLKLFGRDLDAEHIPGAQENASQLGFEEFISIESGDACSFPFKKGWGATIASNLPYGLRVGNPEETNALHKNFGASLRAQASGYSFALLVGSRQFAHLLGFQKWDSLPIQNGSLQCRLLLGDL
ncbi:MAG: THUMP domain-containing protein [Planctomycetes bacterium]|nr:THUMP domain-containing protein [Planctomycetota bacterium]